MTTPSDLLAEQDRRRINDAVAAAQKWTAAEILAVVVCRSSRYDDVRALAGLLVALALAAAWRRDGDLPYVLRLQRILAALIVPVAIGLLGFY